MTTTHHRTARGDSKQAQAPPSEAQPILNQRGPEIQKYGTVRFMPIGLDEQARQKSVDLLNQLLADTITLYSMYKKHHWQVMGPTFYELHLLFDKHAAEQLALVDTIAERIQALGGVATGMPADVAEQTRIDRPPKGSEGVPVMISRLLDAHELICTEVREDIDLTDESKDWGTNDLLMSDVLRLHEIQVWFLAQHLVDVPLVQASNGR
ncbi:MAG TPA: DNA starvation/stationary phase protection protein [Chloroflexia bacterium]|jgi:starvation-inducible DNA-binding protein|nr:DNA starvation/stationary phase protection protein [Chloroflexia bacterium]